MKNESKNTAQVKRFVAQNMRRALELVREELGPEAVILSSQKIKEGVEIITSIEPDLLTRGIDDRRGFGQKFDVELDRAMSSDGAWKEQANFEQAVSSYTGEVHSGSSDFATRRPSHDLAKEIERAREKMLEAKRRAKEVSAPIGEHPRESVSADSYDNRPALNKDEPLHSLEKERVEKNYANASQAAYSSDSKDSTSAEIHHQSEEHRLEELQSELAEMRMLLEHQLWKTTGQQSEPYTIERQQQIKLPAQYPLVRDHLQRLGLTEGLTEMLAEQIGSHKRANEAWRACMGKLAKMIPISHDDIVKNGGLYAFVGQTGVGKTTTIAKLAAKYVLQHGAGKVALVTTDTYRVGAYDQLRSIGRILNIPVKAVDGERSLLTLLAKLQKYSLILVDTAGFRNGDPLLKAQLNQIDMCQSLRKVLVLSSASQLPTNKASVHAFSSKKPIDSCVITKLDETASLGEAISTVIESRLPVCYTTDGQAIPEDIAIATGAGLVAKATQLVKKMHMESSQTVGNQRSM